MFTTGLLCTYATIGNTPPYSLNHLFFLMRMLSALIFLLCPLVDRRRNM